ncbi:hypothetical protein T4B_9056 [Trichinella pseudospiralis]|uniref:Uncharacterized protein n=1 Tax=Trichinella pseudospiralis TaxID=6337 RepID=A0A0V1GPB7_TRIPS|nr:hypothetical protein T4B_9056 [Trichinella pseudospiralis]
MGCCILAIFQLYVVPNDYILKRITYAEERKIRIEQHFEL